MNKFTRLILTCLCLSVAAMGPSTAFAAKKKKAKSSKSVKVKQESGSAEGTKDRERRLAARMPRSGECWGLRGFDERLNPGHLASGRLLRRLRADLLDDAKAVA